MTSPGANAALYWNGQVRTAVGNVIKEFKGGQSALPQYLEFPVKDMKSFEEIRKRLVLKTKDTYMVRKVVKRILEELEGNLFIKELKEERLNGKYSYGYTKNRWKEINK